MQLVLSLFPGIDLLGRGFEAEGFSVVRGPDLVWGGDICTFDVPASRFDGVIAGSPCQDFSKRRRKAPTGYGLAMLAEFVRVVLAASPEWFLLENVSGVPDIEVPGYSVQRFDLRASECGLAQGWLRHFQYGSRCGLVLSLARPAARAGDDELEPAVLASDTRRGWADACELQGLPRNFSIPALTKEARYRAVGNGVPIPMGRLLARAVLSPVNPALVHLCNCGCGRPLQGKQKSALPACRKRIERARREAGQCVTEPGGESQVGSHVTEPVLMMIDESHVTHRGLIMPGVSHVSDQALQIAALSR